MAERLSVEQDVVGSSPTSLPFLFPELVYKYFGFVNENRRKE